MTARLVKGKESAETFDHEIARNVPKLNGEKGIVPGLVTILISENRASVSYVRVNQKTAHELGCHSVREMVPADKRYKDKMLHGILVQLPVPMPITLLMLNTLPVARRLG